MTANQRDRDAALLKAADYDRCAIVIPALNPSERLLDFVEELSARGLRHIFIINDGSAQAFDPVFDKLKTSGHCIILTHERNLGKGSALKTAFHYIMRQFPGDSLAGVVTADADGQHRVEDVLRVAAELQSSHNTVVLGSRTFEKGKTPFRSLFGNKVTSRIFQGLYGVYLKDTQTGLRGIPMDALEWSVRIAGSRYEYEINFLIQAKRRNYSFTELNIETLYFDNNKDSHYNPLKDGARVFVTMLAGLARYAYSSVASAATDVIAFFLLNQFIFAGLDVRLRLFLATLLARIASSAINFSLNQSVFSSAENRSKMQAVRYYTLWCFQLLASYGLVYLFSFFSFSDTVSKILVDLVLAVISYQVQLNWVFRTQKDSGCEQTGE